jgi:hypothetical protein
MALFAALMRAQRERTTFYVTWEETVIQGAYIDAYSAEGAIRIARTGEDNGRLVDVSSEYVAWVSSRDYEARPSGE